MILPGLNRKLLKHLCFSAWNVEPATESNLRCCAGNCSVLKYCKGQERQKEREKKREGIKLGEWKKEGCWYRECDIEGEIQVEGPSTKHIAAGEAYALDGHVRMQCTCCWFYLSRASSSSPIAVLLLFSFPSLWCLSICILVLPSISL